MTENHGSGATTAFLEALYGTADEDLSILIWSLPDKQSRWFGVRGRDAIGDAVQMIAGNVYVGAGLLSEPLGPKHRGKANLIAGIPGVWADIDYGEMGHEKQSLPPTMLDAARLIGEFPLKPTIVVHSGYGFQCWWLFHEFWRFDDSNERERAAALLHGWHKLLMGHSQRHGWAMDSMFDLARVMRLPGTWNVKHEPRQPVRLDELHDDLRYGIEDLEQLCPAVDERAESEPVQLDDLPADPPHDKFVNLLENDDEFKRIYHHKKKLEDDSLSGYDLALANVVAKADWSDEEIVGLLVAHRRKYGGGEAKHKSYYERTIGKARAAMERAQGASRLDEMYTRGLELPRDEVLKIVSSQLGVQVTGLIEYTGSDSIYRLETNQRSILLGPSRVLRQQGLFQEKLIQVAGVFPEPVKTGTWSRLITALLSIRQQQSTGDENTEPGAVQEWLSTYLFHCRDPLGWDEIEDAVKSKTPFLSRDGELCIYSGALRAFILERAGERISRNDLAAMLAGIGCEPRAFPFTKHDGTRTSTSAWVVPENALYRATNESD